MALAVEILYVENRPRPLIGQLCSCVHACLCKPAVLCVCVDATVCMKMGVLGNV